MTVDLLPCPFCGGSASIEQFGDRGQSTIYQCDHCSCRLETGEESDHARIWNTRELSPATILSGVVAEICRQAAPPTTPRPIVAELSPVRRLGKSHANDASYGSHMVDIIDRANWNVIASCVYERYADEIIRCVNLAIDQHLNIDK